MKKILVVDDDQSTLDLVKTILKNGPHKVMTAKDGRTALSLARKHKPDLVLLDIMMPDVHGLTVCYEIKNSEELKGMKVVILSSKSFAADQMQAKEAGADRYLIKPVTKKEILDTVSAFLG